MIMPVWTIGQKRAAGVLAGVTAGIVVIAFAIGELPFRLSQIWTLVLDLAAKNNVPLLVTDIASLVIQCSMIIGFIAVSVLFMVCRERKTSARMQSRLGP